MPFDPKSMEMRRRRFRPIPVRMLLPNVITLLAICAGLTAIRLSTEGRMELAVAAIVFAAVLDGIDGRVGVIQIAGLVARRIVSFVREGQTIGTGERFGLIRFGSRLDVFLPEGTKPLVSEGQTAVAGETILADFRLSDAGRTYRAD